ncbi:MAG: serine/threonine protein kinase [Myxococcales bacterium]|nr:serine/threonine protein kinase [Myxococcales bacterium]
MGSPPVQPGDVLGGKYRVERVLGAGGMGVVVAARHVDLGHRFALKFMLREAMTDPAATERFMREARAAVQLQSPHTARVSDVGRLSSGEPYMVMEYLEGRDLDAVVVQHGPLAPPVAVEYVLQASEAIAEAHALGIVHRDVKLKNLFLTRAVDGRDLVKVLDFGLAKTVGSAGEVSLTQTSAVFGSPQYMSPEQMKSAKDVDGRADIWALGVCLYELLTARLPFDGSTMPEICAMVLKDEPAPPSTVVDTVPPDLEAIVLRCLEKDPERRFQSVADLAHALEPFGARSGSSARIRNVAAAAARATPRDDATRFGVADLPVEPDEAKTVNAWQSGGAHGPKETRTRVVMSAALGVSVAAIILLATTLAVFIVRLRRPSTDPVAAPMLQSADAPAAPGGAGTSPVIAPSPADAPVAVARPPSIPVLPDAGAGAAPTPTWTPPPRKTSTPSRPPPPPPKPAASNRL